MSDLQKYCNWNILEKRICKTQNFESKFYKREFINIMKNSKQVTVFFVEGDELVDRITLHLGKEIQICAKFRFVILSLGFEI